MEKRTKTALWIAGAVVLAAGLGFAVYKLVLQPSGTGGATAGGDEDVPVEPTGTGNQDPALTKPPTTGTKPPATTTAPTKPTGTAIKKLPAQYVRVNLKFRDGVPFSVGLKSDAANVQVPALSVNKSWSLTQKQKDEFNLALAKGATLEEVATSYMAIRGFTDAYKVKNSK